MLRTMNPRMKMRISIMPPKENRRPFVQQHRNSRTSSLLMTTIKVPLRKVVLPWAHSLRETLTKTLTYVLPLRESVVVATSVAARDCCRRARTRLDLTDANNCSFCCSRKKSRCSLLERNLSFIRFAITPVQHNWSLVALLFKTLYRLSAVSSAWKAGTRVTTDHALNGHSWNSPWRTRGRRRK